MIGIIGGTFDPIHFGHLRPALEISEKLELSECRFIPSAKPPHRWQPKASVEHRNKMVKRAIKQYPGFVFDDREYQRLVSDDVPSYTIDTVQSIRKEIDDEPLAMIVGMDAFQSFTKWRDWEKILENVHLIVAARPGYSDEQKQQAWVKARLTEDTKDLHNASAGLVYFCEVTQLDISATFIRNRIKDGQSCAYLTPKKVLKYLTKHALYASWS